MDIDGIELHRHGRMACERLTGGNNVYILVFMNGKPQLVERARAARAGAVCTCFNLRKAARAVTQLYDERLREVGLRATQLTLLMALRSLGEMTLTGLAEEAVIDRTTLSRNLGLLEKRGLVSSRPGEDRRERLVSLTAKGQKTLAEAFSLWEGAQAEMVDGLGEKRLARFLADLTEVVSVARA